jgi:selenide,water dikinase
MKRILLVGAGHAHVNVVREFGRSQFGEAELTLLSSDELTPYSGMLPGHIAGHYSADDIHIDAAALARRSGALFRRGTACGIDLARGLVRCEDGGTLAFDVLSLDIGSSPNTRDVPGADDHAVPVKPISRFLPAFAALRSRALSEAKPVSIAVVGSGPGGIELLLAVEHRLRHDLAEAGRDASHLSFVLIASSKTILSGMPAKVQERFAAILAARGIRVRTSSKVRRVEGDRLHLLGGDSVKADVALWVTEAAAAPWLAETGLHLDPRGFVRVDACLRAVGHANVFAAGDVASFDPHPIPRSGVYAVRAGERLADNLRLVASGREPKPFTPQGEALYLITTGGKHAVGTRNGITFAGRWVWHWKDFIDRRFMARYR